MTQFTASKHAPATAAAASDPIAGHAAALGQIIIALDAIVEILHKAQPGMRAAYHHVEEALVAAKAALEGRAETGDAA